jgi:hypothetical protein
LNSQLAPLIFPNRLLRYAWAIYNRDALLETKHSHRKLYIALPEDIYNKHFLDPFIIKIRVKEQMGIIVFNPKTRRIIRWEK